MPEYVITSPDGRKFRVTAPEGATQEQVLAFAQSQFAPQETQEQPTQQSALPRPLETIGALTGGIADAGTFGFADELTARLNALVPLDRLGGVDVRSVWSGTPYSEAVAHNLEQQRALDRYNAEHNKAARLAGQVAGGVASGFLTGGTATGLRGAGIAAGQGAAYGFGSGEGSVQDRLDEVLPGAAGGVVGYGLGRGVARVLNPQTSRAARELIDEGVPLTPGQIAGGVGRTIEDKATSIPVLGEAISSARRRGIEGFNKAAINRALKPIGKKLPEGIEAGYDAVEYAQDELSNAYRKLLPSLKVRADQQFADDLKNLSDLASEMPSERFNQFQQIVNRHIIERFSKNGTMSGEAMKEAESELGRLARSYMGSSVADERLLGNALREAQSQLRQLVERSNPSKAVELKAINRGFANLVRAERAASSASGGVFTPGQLQTATRVLDSSTRKTASARGDALMQDLATAGREVLPSTVPDSGTAGRLLPWLIGGGSVMGTQSDDPTLQTLGALGLIASGAYTRPGQALMTHAMTSRPEAVRQLGALLGGVPLAVPGGVLATQP